VQRVRDRVVAVLIDVRPEQRDDGAGDEQQRVVDDQRDEARGGGRGGGVLDVHVHWGRLDGRPILTGNEPER
jgi:hypothetical protein